MTKPDVDAALARMKRQRKAREGGNQQKRDVLPVTEFADLSTLSRKRWIVHHLVAADEVSAWYGEPGSGKSVLIEDLGLHVAAGRSWFGRKISQGAVLYVALERAGVVARRAIAFGKRYEIAALPFAMVRGPLDFRDTKTSDKIITTARDLAARHEVAPALIIVDTVSRALCGGDENSPKDMGLLVAGLSRIQSAGVHLAMTHHQPAEKERMRGHGALLGAVDTTVHVYKSGANRIAEVVKSSDHEEGQRIAFTLDSVIIGQDEHGDPMTAPVVVEDQAGGPAARASKPPPNGAAKVALNALREAVSALGAVPPASNYVPPATKTVTIDQWRDFAYRRGISGSSDKPRARQAAFQRAVQSLSAAGWVGIWEPHAWPA